MTIHEFYANVESIMYALQRNESISVEEIVSVREKASEMLASLDARNEKRKSADSKEKRETASRRETVLGLLSETPVFAESIADASGLTVGQVRSALSTLVREGKASKSEVKDGKSRKMAYSLHAEA